MNKIQKKASNICKAKLYLSIYLSIFLSVYLYNLMNLYESISGPEATKGRGEKSM